MSLYVHSRPFAVLHAKYLYKTKIITSFDTFDAHLRIFHTAKLKRFTFTLHIAFVTCIINNEIYKLNTMQMIYDTTYLYWLFSLFLSVLFFSLLLLVFIFWFATVLALESKKIQVRVAYPRHPYISIHLRWTVYWVHRCLRGYDNHMMVALKLMSGAINFLSVGSPITQNMDIIFSRGSRNIHILHNMRKYWHSG